MKGDTITSTDEMIGAFDATMFVESSFIQSQLQSAPVIKSLMTAQNRKRLSVNSAKLGGV